MPKPNSLYFFLEHFVLHRSSISSSSSSESNTAESTLPIPDLRESIAKAKYAMINLAIKKTKLGMYQIAELHISAFEDLNFNSPYHLTIKLTDVEGKKFILHVYFDNKNSIIEDLTSLSLLTEDGTEQVDISKADKELFHEFALGELSEITAYRSLQEKRVEGLTEHIETELASISSTGQTNLKDIERCFKKTEDLLDLAQQLHSIGGSKKIVDTVKLLVKKLDWAITDKMQDVLPTPSAKVETKENKENAPPSQKSQGKAKTKRKSVSSNSSSSSTDSTSNEQERIQSEQNKTIKELDASIKKLNDFGGLLQAGKLKKVSELVEYNNAATEAFSNLRMCEALEIEVNCAHEINIFRHLILSKNQCILTLEFLIFKGETPRELIPYVKFLRPDFVRNAIATNKSKLLDWLLTHGNFAIDTLMLKDGGRLKHPLLYAYSKDLFDSFKVLVKHNACLWVPNDSGKHLYNAIMSISSPSRYKDAIGNVKILRLYMTQSIDIFNMCLSFELSKSLEKAFNKGIKKAQTFLNKSKDSLQDELYLAEHDALAEFDRAVNEIMSFKEIDEILSSVIFKKMGAEGELIKENGIIRLVTTKMEGLGGTTTQARTNLSSVVQNGAVVEPAFFSQAVSQLKESLPKELDVQLKK